MGCCFPLEDIWNYGVGGAFAVGSHHYVAEAGNGLKESPGCWTALLCVQSTLVLRAVYLAGFCFCLWLKVFQGILVPPLRGEMILTVFCSCCLPAFSVSYHQTQETIWWLFCLPVTGGAHVTTSVSFFSFLQRGNIYFIYLFLHLKIIYLFGCSGS